MTYRVQVRDQAMNVFAWHDCAFFDEAVELAQAWYIGGRSSFYPEMPIEIVFVVSPNREEVTT